MPGYRPLLTVKENFFAREDRRLLLSRKARFDQYQILFTGLSIGQTKGKHFIRATALRVKDPRPNKTKPAPRRSHSVCHISLSRPHEAAARNKSERTRRSQVHAGNRHAVETFGIEYLRKPTAIGFFHIDETAE